MIVIKGLLVGIAVVFLALVLLVLSEILVKTIMELLKGKGK